MYTRCCPLNGGVDYRECPMYNMIQVFGVTVYTAIGQDIFIIIIKIIWLKPISLFQ